MSREISSFVRQITAANADLEDNAMIRHPNYKEIQTSLVEASNGQVTLLKGGPLDLRSQGIDSAWLNLVNVTSANDCANSTTFHIISLNQPPSSNTVPCTTEFNFALETDIKLGSQDSQTQSLRAALSSGDKTPRVIIRPSFIGNIAYPLIAHPGNIPVVEILDQRVKTAVQFLSDTMHVQPPDTTLIDWTTIEQYTFQPWGEFEHGYMSEPRVIQRDNGSHIFAYGMLTPDAWGYYELYSWVPFQELRKKNDITLRVDSGCDNGMLYSDGGCDCHWQLEQALEEIKNSPGLIVHIPGQDGRGYGFNTKLKTEALKNGCITQYPMDTIDAAKKVFGDRHPYDIRTYSYVPLLLRDIGFNASSLRLITDNKEKVRQMAGLGRTIERVPTGSMSNDMFASSLRNNLRAKQDTDIYF